MDDPVAFELHQLDQEERRLRLAREVGVMSERAYRLRLHGLQERRHRLHRGRAWAATGVLRAVLK